jgi:hypothetical protein
MIDSASQPHTTPASENTQYQNAQDMRSDIKVKSRFTLRKIRKELKGFYHKLRKPTVNNIQASKPKLTEKAEKQKQQQMYMTLIAQYSKSLTEGQITDLVYGSTIIDESKKEKFLDSLLNHRKSATIFDKIVKYRKNNDIDSLHKAKARLVEQLDQDKITASTHLLVSPKQRRILSKLASIEKKLEKHDERIKSMPIYCSIGEVRANHSPYKKIAIAEAVNTHSTHEYNLDFQSKMESFFIAVDAFKKDVSVARELNSGMLDNEKIDYLLQVQSGKVERIQKELAKLLKDPHSRTHIGFLYNDMLEELEKVHNVLPGVLPKEISTESLLSNLKNSVILKERKNQINADSECNHLLENMPRLLVLMAEKSDAISKGTFSISSEGEVPHTAISKSMQDYLFVHPLSFSETDRETYKQFRMSVARFRGMEDDTKIVALQKNYYQHNSKAALSASAMTSVLMAVATTPVGTIVYLYPVCAALGYPLILAHSATPPGLTDIVLGGITRLVAVPAGTLIAPISPSYHALRYLQKKTKEEYKALEEGKLNEALNPVEAPIGKRIGLKRVKLKSLKVGTLDLNVPVNKAINKAVILPAEKIKSFGNEFYDNALQPIGSSLGGVIKLPFKKLYQWKYVVGIKHRPSEIVSRQRLLDMAAKQKVANKTRASLQPIGSSLGGVIKLPFKKLYQWKYVVGIKHRPSEIVSRQRLLDMPAKQKVANKTRASFSVGVNIKAKDQDNVDPVVKQARQLFNKPYLQNGRDILKTIMRASSEDIEKAKLPKNKDALDKAFTYALTSEINNVLGENNAFDIKRNDVFGYVEKLVSEKHYYFSIDFWRQSGIVNDLNNHVWVCKTRVVDEHLKNKAVSS